MNNNQSPLIPQGSLLDQKNKGRTRVRIAVFIVLAIHGIGLLALLMQGCRKPDETALNHTTEPTNSPPTFETPSNPPTAPETNPAPAVPPATTNPPAPTLPETATTNPPVPPAPELPIAGTQYKIVAHDTYAKIAKKFHVPVKAIVDANPGVDPTRLKVDQTIHIPAAGAPSATTGGVGPGAGTEAAVGGQTYVVKSGDSLTKIAGEHGVTVKALRAANALKTDKIRVGQKLKIPAKAGKAPAGTAPPLPNPEPGASGPAR